VRFAIRAHFVRRQAMGYLEQIEDGVPRYNNFFFHWDLERGMFSDVKRKEPYMVRFRNENPEFDRSLCDKVTSRKGDDVSTTESLKPLNTELYQAYTIIKTYGVADDVLFS